MRKFALAVLLAALAAGCGKKPEPSGNAPAPDRMTTDNDRLQGVWAVEGAETGPGIGDEHRKEIVAAKIHVHSERLTLGDERYGWEHYTFTVDETKDPKVLIWIEAKEDGTPKMVTSKGKDPKPPLKTELLYKFDGNKLVLAMRNDDDVLPKNFKLEPGQRGMIWTLVKTKDEPRKDWATPRPRPTTKK